MGPAERLAVASIRSSLKAHDGLPRRKEAQLVHVIPRPWLPIFTMQRGLDSVLSLGLATTSRQVPKLVGILRMIEPGSGIRFQE